MQCEMKPILIRCKAGAHPLRNAIHDMRVMRVDIHA